MEDNILGYDSVDGKLVPNEDAEIVRIIFQLYLEGKGLTEIAEKLNSLGLTGRSGKPLTDKGILYILGNEAYVGDKTLQKRAPKNYLTKQPDKHAQFESNYLVDEHEPVIDRLTWDMAQNKLDLFGNLETHNKMCHNLHW